MILSIIIPVFNTEAYIKTTLDSIFSQHENSLSFEVIVVNDGTKDHAMDIVFEYANKHSEIKIIEQDNKGLSVARNTGLKKTTGDYVWFVDSDDSITHDAFCFIQNIIKNRAEMYALGMNCMNETTKIVQFQSPLYKTNAKYFGALMSGIELQKKIHMTPVQRFLYRKDFLEKHNLVFYPGIYHEDNDFQPRANYFAKKICIYNYAIYNYLLRETSSITSTPKIKNLRDKLTIINNLMCFIRQKVKDTQGRQMVYDNIFNLVIGFKSTQSKTVNGYQELMAKNRWFLYKICFTSFIGSISYCSFGKIMKFIKFIL